MQGMAQIKPASSSRWVQNQANYYLGIPLRTEPLESNLSSNVFALCQAKCGLYAEVRALALDCFQQTTIYSILGSEKRDNGKENGNYRDYRGYIGSLYILALYRDNGSENGKSRLRRVIHRNVVYNPSYRTSKKDLRTATQGMDTQADAMRV